MVTDSWKWSSGQGESAQIGYVNRNGQRCAGHCGAKGTDHQQFAYKVECTNCCHVYGANGSDLHERRCPECQSGAPGIRYWRQLNATVAPSGTFELISFDEGGVQGAPENLRLVCIIKGGGKLAIWGKKGARRNIDAILEAGVPCVVECNYRPPSSFAASKSGHTQWVQEDYRLVVRS